MLRRNSNLARPSLMLLNECMTIDIDTLWSRLRAHEGETFTQIRGGTFTYAVTSSAVIPDRTNRTFPQSDLGKALDLVPLRATTDVHHLQGPSYVYAILMDDRIRRDDW